MEQKSTQKKVNVLLSTPSLLNGHLGASKGLRRKIMTRVRGDHEKELVGGQGKQEKGLIPQLQMDSDSKRKRSLSLMIRENQRLYLAS